MLWCSAGKAQPSVHPVPGLPTKEIYDLHLDRKGYLWIAHSVGLSRYDGLNFTHYTHGGQASLRTMGIVEDSSGRIWCHNFSGQVYYITQGQMKSLDAYLYKEESQFPRMALCGNELLVTSQRGLFVCNTGSLKSRYIPFDLPAQSGTVSLAVVRDRAVVYTSNGWYVYHPKSGITKLQAEKGIMSASGNTLSLHPYGLHDTVFFTANPAGMLQKLVLKNDKLKVVGQQVYHDFINSISVNDRAWIHTRNKSATLDKAQSITALNLSDMVSGADGNTWYSSLTQGLMVNYRPSLWQVIHFPTDTGDYVRSLNVGAGYFFGGTQKGNLIVMAQDKGAPSWRHNLFNGLGSIDFIRYHKDHLFLVGSSVNTYLVNPKEKKIEDLLPLDAILDVDFDSTSLYLATTSGFYVQPLLTDPAQLSAWIDAKKKAFPFIDWHKSTEGAYLFSTHRTRAVRLNNEDRSIWVATKNSLQEIDKKGIHAMHINGKEVFATSLWYKQSRMYIATINDGLWIQEKDSLKHYTTANALFSNTILRLKVTGDHLWLFQTTGLQVFDTKTDRVLQNIDLPLIEGDNVFDVAEKNGYAYLTTAKGIYKVPLNRVENKPPPSGFLDFVQVNNRDTFVTGNISLPYDQNDIQFFFSSPALTDPASISFKYRLHGADADWQLAKPNERMLRYSSLMPGTYEFEAVAVNNYGVQQVRPITFAFTILKPWWSTWWFIAGINAIILAIVLLIIQNRVQQKLKMEWVRLRISSDLHDDIGATLSSVNVYASLARTQADNKRYLSLIQQHITDAISRLDDLVWSINPKNDTAEQLIKRMKATAVPLLEAAGVACHFYYDRKVLDLKLDLYQKRHVYLLFKEMINNVVKHAQATHCNIRLECVAAALVLTVSDDGKGFDPHVWIDGRNGLHNMQARAEQVNGTLHISAAPGKGTTLAVKIKTGKPC
jgi:two-component sensor histidine kinase